MHLLQRNPAARNPGRNPAGLSPAARSFAGRVTGSVTDCGRGFPRLSTALAAMAAMVMAMSLTPSAGAGSPLDAELFSEISMSETVADASRPPATSSKTTGTVLGAASLSKLLSADGIQCAVVSSAVRVEVAELLPANNDDAPQGTLLCTVDADADRIDVVLPVDNLPVDASGNEQSVDGEKLMALLVAMQNHDHVQLVASGKTLALHTSLSNQGVTADGLRTVAERLALAATKTTGIAATVLTKQAVAGVNTNDTPPGRPAITSADTTSVATKATATKSAAATLVGTWSAKTSASDAWAIRFDADDNFVMVHTRSGKNSVSRGTYQTTGDRLVLSESSGVSLTGTLERTSGNAFRWRLQNTGGDVVATLSFSKQ
ncbi:lipocalin family protein [Planctomycetes bacterium TBK1r]